MRLTLGEIAEAAGGRLTGGEPGHFIDGVSTDTRAIVPGGLFVALRGEKFDGHDFADEAIAAGKKPCHECNP